MLFPTIFFFIISRIFQIALIVAAVCICVSLLRNTTRIQACAVQTPPPPNPPNVVYVQRRGCGCTTFLGTFFIIGIILFGILGNLRHQKTSYSEPEKRIHEISNQKREINNRLEKEIPEFVRLLYTQAQDIKKELNNTNDASKKSYLMDELNDIARTFVFLDQEESGYKDLVSELSSIERSLIRLKESEKLFGSEYDDFMDKSRETMIKAQAKLNVKINLEIDRNVALNEIKIQEKIDELLE